MKSLVPDTGLVADVSALYGTEREPAGRETWLDVFGGVRQRIVRREAANVFGQFLLGSSAIPNRFPSVFPEVVAPSQTQFGRPVSRPESVPTYRSVHIGPPESISISASALGAAKPLGGGVLVAASAGSGGSGHRH